MSTEYGTSGRENFSERVAELRRKGHKVTTWYSEEMGFCRKAVYVDRGKVMIVEEWEKSCDNYNDDVVQSYLDVVVYERGQRPELVTKYTYTWYCEFCGQILDPETPLAEGRRSCHKLHPRREAGNAAKKQS